ncbi:MAG: cytochrome c-type biogenesis protein CcmH [Proteobacteria bacterium]|nr:cytochrome c-type biogenesis protein CcmH [Pseudomonadota bacterium]
MKKFLIIQLRREVLILGVALMLNSVAVAQSPVTERKDLVIDQNLYRDVAGELRCPTCTGLSVLDSDAPFSVQIKNQVKEQLSGGKSEKEILKFFVDRYGPWILRSPPVAGVNALAWIVPIFSMIVGPLLIWMVLGRRRAQLPRSKTSNEIGNNGVRNTAVDVVRSTEDIVIQMKSRIQSMKEGKPT